MKHPTDFTLSTYFRLFMALNSTWPTQFELVFFRGAHKNGCKEIRGEEEREGETAREKIEMIIIKTRIVH